MIFVKFDRLMSEIIDFTDSNINSTILYNLIRKKVNWTGEIRTHNPWIRYLQNNIQRPSTASWIFLKTHGSDDHDRKAFLK
jgi:hypothetical protein